MNSLVVFSILSIALCANGFSATRNTDEEDEVLKTLKCFQSALTTGIPSIGLPGFSPYKFSKNYKLSIPLYEYSLEVAFENLTVYNFPDWTVTQMEQISTGNDDDLIFDYSLYWERVSLRGDWSASLVVAVQEIEIEIFQDVGEFIYEMDRLTVSGRFNFSKDENEKGFDEVTLRLHPEESPLHIEGLGVFTDILDYVGGRTLRDIVDLNLFANLLDAAVQKEFNENWVNKPERVEAVLSACLEQ